MCEQKQKDGIHYRWYKYYGFVFDDFLFISLK